MVCDFDASELSFAKTTLISEWSAETEGKLTSVFSNENIIVLDADGVDLSRQDVICIVQLATREQCFILDVHGKSSDDALVVWLRGILEDDTITKIIHDCRMDSDALLYHLQIRISKVQILAHECPFIRHLCIQYSIYV